MMALHLLDMERDDILKSGNACDHKSIEYDNTEDADDVGGTDNAGDYELEADSSDDCDDCLLDSRIRAKHGEHVIDFQKAHRALVKLICSSEVLPEHVEHGPYRDLMDMICPNFKIDLKLVKSDCLKLYMEEKARVKLIMGNMEGQISLSVDVLKYRVMCLKGHFVDDHWNLRKWVLNFRLIRQCESLADAILMCLKDLDIEGKISTLTLVTDDGEEDEIVEKVKKKVQEKKSFQLNGQLFRVNCCAAMFNLMVKDAFEEISTITHKLYELSWSKSMFPLWYITTSKLKNALQLESMGEFSSQTVRDNYDVPSRDEWKKVEGVCRLVDSTYKIAKVLFETKYPTANIYLYNLQELLTVLTQESVGSCSFTSEVAKKMLARLDTYCKEAFMVLAVASVMDPRLKMQYIEYLCSKCEGGDDGARTVLVLDAIHKLYDVYLKQDLEREDSITDSNSDDSEEEFPRGLEQGLCDPLWLPEYKQFIQINGQSPKSDLDWYLEEPVVPWSQDFNALKWWRAESPKYPVLSKMARVFLAIPLSVATSYEAYYTEQRPADREVVSCGMDLMNALMCTRSWLKKPGGKEAAGKEAAREFLG
ncbi:hypothetical protein RJ640_024799 [Escallonia rubra]|uniref:HAT C-terminal dimerisation domain-containing protein n=1 Tax=Escallonia rubra TaxID=112253 RepID=A0AA88R6J6_9ASTE|nr:hypothetical protein RJ640_024799 [Escallonia rubra]